jgi:glycosyltransferase involved in cell wall biosynthesis
MSKTLVIQIPAYNEASNISQALADLPKTLPGIDKIIVLVVDDGSTDGTADVALHNGADYVVRHRRNRGLANTFITGIQASLALGADIIVNTDADNQYPARYIGDLVSPILNGDADLVIGDRQALKNQHFSPLKRLLEWFGSWVIRNLSETDAPDAPSGFRAYSRFAAMHVQVYNSYSYTLETLIQAGNEKLAIRHLCIETNPTIRPSRLHKGILNFIWRQSGTIIRSYVFYKPLKTFLVLGVPFLCAGVVLIARFVLLYFLGETGVARNIQSVSIGGTLMVFGFLLVLMGLLGDSLRANRRIMQEVLARKRIETTIDELDDEVNGLILIRREGPR